MSTFVQRPPGSGGANPRRGVAKPQLASSFAEARKAPLAHATVLRPIDLERRARFVRGEADVPRGA